MFSEDQHRRLCQTSNLHSKLLVLSLQPNLNLFQALVSVFYSARRSSSPNKRERLLARRELYLSILGKESNLISKVRNTSRLKAEEITHTYREFACHLHRWSARWNAASIDEITSLVVLLDCDFVGFINESMIFNFCASLDEAVASDRTNPHRVIQTMLMKMIDKAHLRVEMNSVDADIKQLFQHFIFDAIHKTKPNISILNKYCAFLENAYNLSNDNVVQFWEEQFHLVRQFTENKLSASPLSSPRAEELLKNEIWDETGKCIRQQQENDVSQTGSVMDALKIKLEVRHKPSIDA